jgi:PilZ domain
MASEASGSGKERRRHRRHAMLAVATLNYDNRLFPCIVTNFSRGGARVQVLEEQALPRGDIVLEATRLGLFSARVVWQRGIFAGLKFAMEIAADSSAPNPHAEPAGAAAPARAVTGEALHP